MTVDPEITEALDRGLAKMRITVNRAKMATQGPAKEQRLYFALLDLLDTFEETSIQLCDLIAANTYPEIDADQPNWAREFRDATDLLRGRIALPFGQLIERKRDA